MFFDGLKAVGFGEVTEPERGLQRREFLKAVDQSVELFLCELELMVGQTVLQRLGLEDAEAGQQQQCDRKTPGGRSAYKVGLELGAQQGLRARLIREAR